MKKQNTMCHRGVWQHWHGTCCSSCATTPYLELTLVCGIDPESEGLKLAERPWLADDD